MNIIAICPFCKYAWLLDMQAADRRITCLKCSALFKIPRISQLQKALQIAENSKQKVYLDKNANTYA